MHGHFWAVLTPPTWRVVESPAAPAAGPSEVVIECARCSSLTSAMSVVRDVRLLIEAWAAEPENFDYLREIEAHLMNGYGTR